MVKSRASVGRDVGRDRLYRFVVYVRNFGVFLSVLGNLCWV